MANKIKVILIDPKNKTITEHKILPELEEYYKLMECDMVELVRSSELSGTNVLYADEEGLLKDDPSKMFFFELDGWGTIVGKAIVINHNSRGNSISTTETVETITPLIMFHK